MKITPRLLSRTALLAGAATLAYGFSQVDPGPPVKVISIDSDLGLLANRKEPKVPIRLFNASLKQVKISRPIEGCSSAGEQMVQLDPLTSVSQDFPIHLPSDGRGHHTAKLHIRGWQGSQPFELIQSISYELP